MYTIYYIMLKIPTRKIIFTICLLYYFLFYIIDKIKLFYFGNYKKSCLQPLLISYLLTIWLI